MKHLFSNKKRYRNVCIGLLLTAAVIAVFNHVDIKSVGQYRKEQQSLIDRYQSGAAAQTESSSKNISASSETPSKDPAASEIPSNDPSAPTKPPEKEIRTQTQGSTVTPPQEIKTENETQPGSKEVTCTIEIRCDNALKNADIMNSAIKDYIPQDGVLLRTLTLTVPEGTSAYDILLMAAKINNLAVVGKAGYISSINHIKEFSAGKYSGWMYKINGETAKMGAAGYKAQPGDVFQWVYSCDMGKDI